MRVSASASIVGNNGEGNMVKDFRHACVLVSDLKRSIRFYRDLLGLKVDKVRVVEGEFADATLGRKGVFLEYAKLKPARWPKGRPTPFELHRWHKPRMKPAPERGHISFTVTDLDREYKRLRKRGVKFISAPRLMASGTKLCFGYDPDRNLIEFIEDVV